MKAMTKIACVSLGVISFGALTACQSSNTTADAQDRGTQMMGKHHQGDRHLSAEQREQKQQKRAQYKAMREQMKTACDGKAVGQTVQINAADKTVNGTCQMTFKADHKTMKNMKQGFKAEHTGSMHGQRGEHKMKNMTEEQRAQIKQQFQQKRAERQAHWQAIQQSCAGQTNGKAIQVKMGDKTLDGTCVLQFQAQKAS